MFLCPVTSTKLRSAFVRGVNIWYSPASGGRLVTMAVIRRLIGPDAATELWVRSGLKEAVTSWKHCPSCSKSMKIVVTPNWLGAYEIDVCRNCHLSWLDRKDFPQVPVPEDMLTPEGDASMLKDVATEMAKVAIAQDKRHNRPITGDGPESFWKSIPGFIGLPVEMEDDRKNGLGWMTWALALTMLIIHAFLTASDGDFLRQWAFLPAEPFRHFGLTTISFGFLHADWLHLLSNLYFFGVFADDVEVYYGRTKFLLLILGCLVLASITRVLSTDSPNVMHVGMSGAICALMVNYGLIYRKSRIAFLIPYLHSLGSGRFMRVLGWVRISSIWVILGYLAKDAALYFIMETGRHSSISHSGHLFGFLFGFVFWLVSGAPNWYYDSTSTTEVSAKDRATLPYE
jgi:membrane associated rhomboid family serine protease/Zn-finger nucleic acid-binding protein